jgi:multidrug efflux pump subunit AcrA (membrane-fusion protein)
MSKSIPYLQDSFFHDSSICGSYRLSFANNRPTISHFRPQGTNPDTFMKTQSVFRYLIHALLLPLASLPLGCGRDNPRADAAEAKPAVTALAVRAQVVTNRVFERRLTVQGTLEAKRFANVAARVAGNLDTIWVDEGDFVEADKTRLFQIDPVGLSNAWTIAAQELDVSRAGLQVAQANANQVRAEVRKVALDFARYARLHKDGKVSDHEYETAETLNEQAKAGLAVAEAQVELAARQVAQAAAGLAIARKNLEDSLTFAPVSGVISQRLAEPGEQMAIGRTVLMIVDPALIEAGAYLPAQYYPDVVPGTTTFRLDLNGRSAGVHAIDYRSPTINPVLRTFEIKGVVDTPAIPAIPGSMATLTIIFERREGLGVPTSSILVRGGRSVVFVIRDGKAVQTAVTAAFQTGAWTEIASGVRTGDRVVTEGQTLLQDGLAVDVF